MGAPSYRLKIFSKTYKEVGALDLQLNDLVSVVVKNSGDTVAMIHFSDGSDEIEFKSGEQLAFPHFHYDWDYDFRIVARPKETNTLISLQFLYTLKKKVKC